jgi:hypothetical protein
MYLVMIPHREKRLQLVNLLKKAGRMCAGMTKSATSHSDMAHWRDALQWEYLVPN